MHQLVKRCHRGDSSDGNFARSALGSQAYERTRCFGKRFGQDHVWKWVFEAES
jgi:hypothetical protein